MRSLLSAVLVWLVLAAPSAAAEPLRVVASFSTLADLVVQVGGEEVAVSSLVPPGGEPHEWQPEPADVRRIAGADLVVVNGLGLEGWLDRLVRSSGFEGPILVASRDVMPLRGPTGMPDPHAWHSLDEARRYAAAIAQELGRLRPDSVPAFGANLAAFERTLDGLADWAEGRLEAVPPARRVVVTTHDAFAYLGRDYTITFLAPAGLDSAAQPSARRMAQLVEEIRRSGVRTVFRESGGDDRLARTLAAEAGVGVGEPLFAGTLSAPGGAADSYAAMWRYNLSLMLDAMPR